MTDSPISKKFNTLSRILKADGTAAAWSLMKRRIVEATVAMPGGSIRMGSCFFRCPDPRSRALMIEGIYESAERFAVRHFLRRDLPVVEFGGSLGVVACLLNRRLRNPRNHVVVEADPELVPVLTENRDRNRCGFEIINGAAGAEGPTARVYRSENNLDASLNLPTDRFVDVPAVSLNGILQHRDFGRCVVVCDIEGAESRLIRDELATLQAKVELLVVEFHPGINGPDDVDNCLRLLSERGFEQLWRGHDTRVFRNSGLN